jgi:peptide/nickel transport system permease protein
MNLTGIIGGTLLVIILFVVVSAPVIAPYDPNKPSLSARLQPPSWSEEGDPSHLVGTDKLGRDLLSRVLWGGRVSMLVAFSAATSAAVLGGLLGLIAGFSRGAWDTVIMRLADIQYAIPLLIIAAAVIAAFKASMPLLIALLVLWGWVPFARLARGSTLSIMQREFIAAAKGIGASSGRIVFRHVLPNIFPSLFIVWTFQLAYMIIVESSLSFLGIGVPPPTPSWGRMLNSARDIIDVAPWLSIYPGLAIVLTVLSINLIGDWIRDWLDPRARL